VFHGGDLPASRGQGTGEASLGNVTLLHVGGLQRKIARSISGAKGNYLNRMNAFVLFLRTGVVSLRMIYEGDTETST
jgi:hypothetical protein